MMFLKMDLCWDFLGDFDQIVAFPHRRRRRQMLLRIAELGVMDAMRKIDRQEAGSRHLKG